MENQMKDNKDPVGSLFGIFSLLAGFVVFPIANGFVLSVLWRWFAVTEFNLRPVSVVHAIGLSLLLAQFHPAPIPETKGDTPDRTKLLSLMITRALTYPLALCVGWLVHLFY